MGLCVMVPAPAAAVEEQDVFEPENPPPSPPYAEGAPVAAPGGGYCYVGAHPVDTRAAAGPAWEESTGPHTHYYPPIDQRLFAFRNGCYYFIGDPSDFGYRGEVFSYYGAHPVLDNHGGGWCFMVGGHGHVWQPWLPHFTVMGSWYYWQGPYDSYFRSYYPYYSFYYRSHYPHYYGGGRFYRNRDFHVAPPISRVPRPPRMAVPSRGTDWRGVPPAGNNLGMPPAASRGFRPHGNSDSWRGTPAAGAAPAVRGSTGNGGWRGAPPANGGNTGRAAPPSGPSGGRSGSSLRGFRQ
jgi:hypothetical protein